MRAGALSILFVAGSAHAEANDSALHFRDHGFSIKPLASPRGEAPLQILAMYMPAQGGFAPNTNVQKQSFAGTLDEYVTLSKSQFSQLGFVVITAKRTSFDTEVLEYKGRLQGADLHFYARAVHAKGQPFIYLVTGTAAESQWPVASTALKACVDSFTLE